MTRPALPCLIALALLAVPAAHAAPSFAKDERLVERAYNPHEVVRIDGRAGVQATIIFGENEQIENVAIGDSTTWQVTPNKRANLLFVKPLDGRAATNMTVVTDRNTYLFDLVTTTKARPLYVLRFTYPDAPEGKAASAPIAPNATELAAATDPYAVLDPAALNFAWGAKGASKLVPARTYDDGEATYLSWPAGQSIPAILITNEEGLEGPVNYAVRGDTVVVDGVPRQIILRSGKERAILTNDGPERSAKATPTAPLSAMTPLARTQEIN